MRAWIPIVLAVTLSGCATHGAHAVHRPDPLHDWATVRSIKHGTHIRATLGDKSVRLGLIEEVTDATLTIRTKSSQDPDTLTIDRARIGSVGVDLPKKTRWDWLGKPFAVGIVAGLAGTIAGAAMKDAKVARISCGVFTGSAIGAFSLAWHHANNYEVRIVYVRP